MKKLLVLFVSALMVLGLATGCSNSGSGDKAGIKIGATIYKFDDNFMSVVRQNMESYAKTLGATLTLNDSGNDQAKQNEQVDNMIADGVNVLAINLVDPTAAPAIIEKAKTAKLPVVFFNKEPNLDVLKSYDKAWYVGTNSAESGIIQGEMIAKHWEANKAKWDLNGDGKIQYVLFKGEIGHPDAEARTKYAVEAIAKIGGEQLALESATWDATKANEIMTTWLSSLKGIEMVVCNNDAMAFGAIAALKNAGYFANDKFMPVFGVDALAEAIQNIADGTMVATVLNDAVNQAKATLDLANNAGKGVDPLTGTSWKFDETGKSVRVAYVGVDASNYKDFK